MSECKKCSQKSTPCDPAQTGNILYDGPDLPCDNNSAFSILNGEALNDILTKFQAGLCGSVISTGIPISSAQLLAGNSSPVQVIPAPGVGKAIQILSVSFQYTPGSKEYTTNLSGIVDYSTNLGIHFDGTNIISGSVDKITSFVKNESTAPPNTAVNFSINSGNPLTGDGTGILSVSYIIVDFPT